MKALGIAASAAIAFAPFSVVATTPGVAEAAPCAGVGSNPKTCEWCQYLVARYHTSNVCFQAAPPRPAPAPPSRAPVQIPPAPPVPPPYAPPSTVPVLIPPNLPSPNILPTIPPPGPDAPSNIPVVAPPRALDAPAQAVAAAKAAPAMRVNPADPPKPPTQLDFNQKVQNVVSAHRDNVDVLRVGDQRLVRPRHWDYLDYDDAYRRPALYNPLKEAMAFRYFYNGAYREAYVPAGTRIVLDAASVGVFPFTAVGDSHVAAGSFYGGGLTPPDGYNGPPPPDYKPPQPPKVYQNVSIYVPANNQTVEVGQVAVVGQDGGQPAGSQDTFLLDDSTLAWGLVDNSSSSSAQIKVIKTQPLPGVGPTDDGGFLVLLAVRPHEEPAPVTQPWWPMALGYGVLGLAVGLFAWVINRRKPSADAIGGSVTDSGHSDN